MIVQGVATEEQFVFTVTKVWKGFPSAKLKLTWPVEHLDSCEGHVPTKQGAEYLITIGCSDVAASAEAVVVDCPSTAQPLDTVSSFLTYLREPTAVTPKDLVAWLHGWRDGTITDVEFVELLGRMRDRASVEDWRIIEGVGSVSPTVSTIRALYGLLAERGVPLSELGCEVAALKTESVPWLICALELPETGGPEVLSTIMEAAEESLDVSCP